MAVTGSSDSHEEEQLGGKNLGVSYDIRKDEISFVVQPCYYTGTASSSDAVRVVTALDQKAVDALLAGSRILTRRNMLSMVMGVYNPLGLYCFIASTPLVWLVDGTRSSAWMRRRSGGCGSRSCCARKRLDFQGQSNPSQPLGLQG